MEASELAFEEGRAVVWLKDGRGLSILTQARNAVIEEAEQYDPLVMIYGRYDRARAGDGTYEVAAITRDNEPGGLIDCDWEEYLTDDHENSRWTTYGYVPETVLMEHINRVGVADGP